MSSRPVKFKERFPFDVRKQQSEKLLREHPERIPVIVEKYEKSDCPDIDKKKFLVQKEMKMAQFICVIRRRIALQENQSLFLFVDNKPPSMAATLASIYDKFRKKHKKDDDGFLYVVYADQETFGQ
ncbi:Autophagy-related protein 8 A (Atg8A) [Monocercomonoides exilis]|uniref:Autophagy-related protein 8 A (Atg8A) n=1 Tax=Monocercomonoides exilis TaxID=2049356 RepID=UPI003559B200|nr:Autophagy-related protein 8 A (Atg8A) [Monocercomonoides exilis]|eukprot:MONOS_2480.1-p1 / transcript=MONOS_2480.1 / gene=MONOS_2480 / organism=Monocercomonoides_exilis_PA203 / gene_product=Autophagy-related protein 8 A (Atg8A) / transcript_product=Autophagy-related protein 8 A (Atg8A) / location=Mono_scaffold00051:118293-118956(-) / protein_length=126 / sequence_SO=supercontig / SO=protein_coding / is_pseudo=false